MSRLASRLPDVLIHASSLAVCALVVAAAGQPLFTDDAWWHLALGREYARHGPWLAGDPLLFTARGAPTPASWLADLALYGALGAAGFGGLRALHVACVALILVLAWSLLRRASGSAAVASLGTAAFAALSAYRLIQLRPDLVTILATLVLYRLVLEREVLPSPKRIALVAGLMLVWANLHGGFLVGPVLLAAAAAGLWLAAPLRRPERRALDRARALRLGIACALGAAATLVNPAGLTPHRAWFVSGTETPSVLRVADEWLPVDPFALPAPGLPPSPLAWGLWWALLAFAVAAAVLAVAGSRRGSTAAGERSGPDPGRLAVAALGLAAPLLAVRFLWLAILPMLALARGLRGLAPLRPVARWGAAALALALAPGFVRGGDWPMISQAISLRTYGLPYPAGKWYAHAVWFLDDAGIEGNAFTDYFMGGFLGYWRAPELRAFANGTLNVSSETLDAGRALRERRGAAPGESFLELLDREGIDVFVGIHLPEVGNPNRPWNYTTAHLEGAPGWIPVFRNLRSAVYLRDDARNAANLERVKAYYEKAGIPFDPTRGFDAWRVLREQRAWALSHGLVTTDFDRLAAWSRGTDLELRRRAWDRLASLYAALGLYEEAVETDRRLLHADPDAERSQRRLVWSLLRLGRAAEAAEAAAALDAAKESDWLSHETAATARAAAAGEADAPQRIALLPVFRRGEAARILARFPVPLARPPRR